MNTQPQDILRRIAQEIGGGSYEKDVAYFQMILRSVESDLNIISKKIDSAKMAAERLESGEASTTTEDIRRTFDHLFELISNARRNIR